MPTPQRHGRIGLLAAATAVVASLIVAVSAATVAGAAGVKRFRDCRGCPEMVVVPAGRAPLGGDPEAQAKPGTPPEIAAHEQPRHDVDIARPFALQRDFVTRGQFAAFVAATKRATPRGCNALDPVSKTWRPDPEANWRDPGFAQTADDPVVCVSWPDAVDYTLWLSAKTGRPYRLPSEAEYEYAARAGSDTLRYWGDDPATVCAHANVSGLERAHAYGLTPTPDHFFACDDRFVQTSPAGRFPPNAFGLYDMLGDVWEWTLDCYHPDEIGAHPDGSPRLDGDCGGHMDKGSSWVNSPHYLSAAARHKDLTDNRDTVLGFRVVRDLTDTPLKDSR